MYKHFIEGKKVVCFDLDGTIVDDNAFFVLAFEKILKLANDEIYLESVYGQLGESLVDKWGKIADQKLIKNNMTVKELVENTNKEFLRLFFESGVEPRDGFWALMYKLREELGIKTALTTNTDKVVAMQIVNKLEIANTFDFMVFGDEVKHKKPHPEMYIKAAKHFGVKTKEMLVFEDSISGVKAAHKAGCSVIVIWDGQTSKSNFPYEVLAFTSDFDGIPQNLDYTAKEVFENFKKEVNEWQQRQQTQKLPRQEI